MSCESLLRSGFVIARLCRRRQNDSPRMESIISSSAILTDQDLKDNGVLLGHRRKMLAAAGEAPATPHLRTERKRTTQAERRHSRSCCATSSARPPSPHGSNPEVWGA